MCASRTALIALGKVEKARACRRGFTLIEMLLVLFCLVLLTQFTFYSFPKASLTEQVEQELESLSDAIYLSQQYAITHKQSVAITLYKKTGKYISKNNVTKEVIVSHDTNQLLESMMGVGMLKIKITSNGTFSNSASYYFKTPIGQYRFVLLIGQGRFYYEKN